MARKDTVGQPNQFDPESNPEWEAPEDINTAKGKHCSLSWNNYIYVCHTYVTYITTSVR